MARSSLSVAQFDLFAPESVPAAIRGRALSRGFRADPSDHLPPRFLAESAAARMGWTPPAVAEVAFVADPLPLPPPVESAPAAAAVAACGTLAAAPARRAFRLRRDPESRFLAALDLRSRARSAESLRRAVAAGRSARAALVAAGGDPDSLAALVAASRG